MRLLLLALLLTACSAKKTEDSVNNSGVSTHKNKIHELPNNEAKLVLLEQIKRGSFLSTVDTELCLLSDTLNKHTISLCVLSWSFGKEHSDKIISHIKSNILQSPEYIFSGMNRRLFSHLDFAAISEILKRLNDAPSWISLKILHQWVISNPNNKYDFNKIAPRLLEEIDKDPASIYEMGVLLREIKSTYWHGFIQEYCIKSTDNDIAVRCLRFISLFAINKGIIPKELLLFIPEFKSATWVLFQRSFPHRARAIELSLRKET